MQAEIITIGDELLIGQVIDTNSAFIAKALNGMGVEVYQITSVHDDGEQIKTSLQNALQRVKVVIITGGLGPTKDDITKKVLCDFFNTELVANTDVERHVRELYRERTNVLNCLTATQWLVPASATILPNRIGSAPIMTFHEKGKVVFSLPGVPKEMETGIEEQVIPYLQRWSANQGEKEKIQHINVKVAGIPESALALLIGDWENNLPPFIHLAYLPSQDRITLRVSAYYDEKEDASYETELKQKIAELQALVRPYLVDVEKFL